MEPDETCELSNNLFFNVSPLGSNAITVDPLFVQPGFSGKEIDMHDPERLAGYRLQENSPCIDAGLFMNENGEKDFWGNPLYNRLPDIGAYERW